jgi:hypothetical protein
MVTKLSSGSGIGTSISADSGGGGTNGDTDKLSGKDINYISVFIKKKALKKYRIYGLF